MYEHVFNKNWSTTQNIRIQFKNIMCTRAKIQLHSLSGQRAHSEVESLSFCSLVQKWARKSKVIDSWYRAHFCGARCSLVQKRGQSRALSVMTPYSVLSLSSVWWCGSVHPHSRLDFPLPTWFFPLQRAKHRKSISNAN